MVFTGFSIKGLSLRNYRNHEHVDWQIDSPFVVLSGPNGAGKTNVLESLCLFHSGRSLRSDSYADMARIGGDGSWQAHIHSQCAGISDRLSTGWSGCAQGRLKRFFRINGLSCDGSFEGRGVEVVFLTPHQDGLFGLDPQMCRDFLDGWVRGLDPGHAQRLHRYGQVLRERRQVLKHQSHDSVWLDVLEHELSQLNVSITQSRWDFMERVCDYFPLFKDLWGDFSLVLEGFVEQELSRSSAQVAEDRLRCHLRSHRQEDQASSRCRLGIHRSRFNVRHQDGLWGNKKSRGEQKRALLIVILSYILLFHQEHGFYPVVLFDEILSHLDCRGREIVLEYLNSLNSQVWITLTHLDEDLFRRIQVQNISLGAGVRDMV